MYFKLIFIIYLFLYSQGKKKKAFYQKFFLQYSQGCYTAIVSDIYFSLTCAVFTQKRCSCGDAPKDISLSVSQTWFQLSLITAPVVSDQSLFHTTCSLYCRIAEIWKFYSKNRQTAATPIVLFAIIIG